MIEPEKKVKPLDMTSEEAVNFLFPQAAIDELKKVANPDKHKVSTDEVECDDESYVQDSV